MATNMTLQYKHCDITIGVAYSSKYFSCSNVDVIWTRSKLIVNWIRFCSCLQQPLSVSIYIGVTIFSVDVFDRFFYPCMHDAKGVVNNYGGAGVKCSVMLKVCPSLKCVENVCGSPQMNENILLSPSLVSIVLSWYNINMHFWGRTSKKVSLPPCPPTQAYTCMPTLTQAFVCDCIVNITSVIFNITEDTTWFSQKWIR